jgi:hypothetical protein
MSILWSSNTFGCDSAKLFEPTCMFLLQGRSFLEEERKLLFESILAK